MIETSPNKKDSSAEAEQTKNDQAAPGQRSGPGAALNSDAFPPLFAQHQTDQFRANWLEIQTRFVDNPKVSVSQADELVTRLIKSITIALAADRLSLEKKWQTDIDEISTEDLRLLLKQYRLLFNRLLSIDY